MEYEARALRRRLRHADGASGTPLTVRTVGIGASGLDELETGLAGERPSAVLATGVAGGLSPDLRPGDLVIAREVGPEPAGTWLSPDPSLVERAIAAARAGGLPARAGRLLTAPSVVATPLSKADAWRRHTALAVDMESLPVLRWAARLGVPALAVRAVADGPAETLPSSVVEAIGTRGGLRPGRVLGWAARPAVALAAWRFWRRSRLALARLGGFLVTFTRGPLDL